MAQVITASILAQAGNLPASYTSFAIIMNTSKPTSLTSKELAYDYLLM
jgi:hypothetical protein